MLPAVEGFLIHACGRRRVQSAGLYGTVVNYQPLQCKPRLGLLSLGACVSVHVSMCATIHVLGPFVLATVVPKCMIEMRA